MKRRWILLAVAIGLVALAANGLGAWVYFYDASRSDRIAQGITIAGVDVGGLRAQAARERVSQRLVPHFNRRFLLAAEDRQFWITPTRVGLHIDVDRMVTEAVRASREGNLVDRFLREYRHRPLHQNVPLRIAYRGAAVRQIVARVAKTLHEDPGSASLKASSTSLTVVRSHEGRAVRRQVLQRTIERRLVDPHAFHYIRVPILPVEPKITTQSLAARYPSFITVSRPLKELRLFRHLKLAKVYRIAVGRQGLETPAGLYSIDDKQVNPSWHVPNSAWAGELAGQVIPPGPDDPIKARWMGFYNGAGIHGTDEISSLGTAASHGCIRMAIPDVEELYDLVPLHTPIYVG
jgi:lipoprotein-anchoring transpeptidase ErfK/SrfK